MMSVKVTLGPYLIIAISHDTLVQIWSRKMPKLGEIPPTLHALNVTETTRISWVISIINGRWCCSRDLYQTRVFTKVQKLLWNIAHHCRFYLYGNFHWNLKSITIIISYCGVWDSNGHAAKSEWSDGQRAIWCTEGSFNMYDNII